jgi:hypothetical protein
MSTAPVAQNASWPKTLALTFGILTVMVSCNEELPPYDEPNNLLVVTVEGQYWLSDTEHYVAAIIRIKNTYEETLEGAASLAGEVIVSFARDPSVTKTLKLSSGNLVLGNYSAGGILRIDPKEVVVLKTVWTFPGDSVFADGGRDLAHHSRGLPPFLRLQGDTMCVQRQLAQPEDLLLQASVTVFTRNSPMVPEIAIFPFCFISDFISTKICPHITTMPPCNYWRR